MDSTWNFTPSASTSGCNDYILPNGAFNEGCDLNDLARCSYALEKSQLDFKTVSHAAMPEIWKILCNEQGRTTDFSYAGVLMWIDFFNYEYSIIDDTLFIKGVVESDRNIPAFSLPVGKMPLHRSIELLRDYCNRTDTPLNFSAVPEYALPLFTAMKPKGIEPLEDWSDYLYEAESLAYLKGKKNGKKRNHVNQFIAAYPEWKLVPMTAANASEALEFMNRFEPEGDKTEMAAAERDLTRFLINCIKEGDNVLKGVMLSTGTEICAISIGDIKRDTAFIHVEKALREFPGSYEMINKEFARFLVENNPSVRYINREDDAGDPGLRLAKQSYHPLTLLKKYNIWF